MEPKWADGVRTSLCDADIILIGSKVVEITKTICTTLFEKESIKMLRMLDFPDSVAERPQRESLIRDTAVSVDSEIPSTSKGFTPQFEPEPVTTKKIKFKDLRSEDAEEITPGDKLCEDELTLIFSNSWISTQDLFNLRLVSKSWRDAATATLLRRDACVVELYGNSYLDPPCFYKHGGKKAGEYRLRQLTELISKSIKFPSTNFRILTSRNVFTSYTDLIEFFKLHGDQIKTICPHGWTTQDQLLDILLVYAPGLEHLDLSKARIKVPHKEKDLEGNDLQLTSKTLPFTCLTLSNLKGNCNYSCGATSNVLGKFRADKGEPCQCDGNETDRDFFQSFLLSSHSKLSCIENVILESLPMVLAKGKGDLIRSFYYDCSDVNPTSAEELTKFVELNPKLTKVTLDLQYGNPEDDLTTINGLLQSSKETVQNLTISFEYHKVAWEQLLSIPQMKMLQSLTLVCMSMYERPNEDPRSTCEACRDVKSSNNLQGQVFEFEDLGISARDYFPNLLEICFSSNFSRLHRVSPMSFFSFQSNVNMDDSTSANWNILPKVDILVIERIDIRSRHRPCGSCQSPTETLLLSETFPNIRTFQFECGTVNQLCTTLWVLCPNVEFMEIYGIQSCSNGGREVEMSHFVDKVFTGFSDGMLKNLRRSAAGHSSKADDSEDLNHERDNPSLSDLRRLREMKLKFAGKWTTEFASSVTGLYALSKMENTKFVISYHPNLCVSGLNYSGGNDGRYKSKRDNYKIAKLEELVFGAIKPYVHIIYEKQNDAKWEYRQ